MDNRIAVGICNMIVFIHRKRGKENSDNMDFHVEELCSNSSVGNCSFLIIIHCQPYHSAAWVSLKPLRTFSTGEINVPSDNWGILLRPFVRISMSAVKRVI